MPERTATTLYRAFDKDGKLLYVGISGRFQSRLGSHARQSLWHKEATNITLEHFSCRDDAINAERIAIQKEKPKLNVAHATGQPPSPKSFGPPIKYEDAVKRYKMSLAILAEPDKSQREKMFDEYVKFSQSLGREPVMWLLDGWWMTSP